ncbi:unnamed protein product, partial [Staurois parvus]
IKVKVINSILSECKSLILNGKYCIWSLKVIKSGLEEQCPTGAD